MDQLQVFSNTQFGDIRTIEHNGEVWFVGIDVATALGYSKAGEAVKTNVSDEDTALMGVLDSNGHTQQTKVINESGLYSLIFGSRLDSAKEFKRWVTGDVLPSIRKTGGYHVGGTELPTTTRGQIMLLMQASEETNQRIDKIENDLANMKDDLPLFPVDQKTITDAVRKKGVDILGGKESEAYHDRSLVTTLYRDIYREIHRNFDVSSYAAIRRADVPRVLDVVARYAPPVILLDRITAKNEVAA